MAQRIVPSSISPGQRVTETRFEVEELWKGRAQAKTLQVQTCAWNDGRDTMTCDGGLTFVVGSRYVVFAAGVPLSTSECQPTALVDRAKDTLLWLSGKARK